MPDLTIHGLSKTFEGNPVLRELSLTVRDGEFFTLLGPSGCGKSTTLHCVAGLERPSAGRIVVGERVFVDSNRGTFLAPEERNLGMVFQSYALWPHMTIAGNLAFPLALRKVPRARQRQHIHAALEKVGLAGLARRYPHQLSGGQQQRVALARALVYSPALLLLDEPLSNLDARLRDQARAWLKQLQGELGLTTVYVTHDQEEALALSDRIAVMSEGRILQVADPHTLYLHPASPEVAAFVGRCNFLRGTLEASDGARHRVRLDDGDAVLEAECDFAAPPGAAVTVAIRPEWFEATTTDRPTAAGTNRLSGTLVTASYVGARHQCQVRLGGEVVEVEVPGPAPQQDMQLALAPTNVRLYARGT